MTDSIYLLAVFCAVAAVAEWLGRLRAGRWLGGAIISLLLGILLANVGLIPTVANAPPLYGYLIAIGAPVAIFLLLLDVRLQALKRAGLPMLVAFGIGALGTLVGVATAFWLTNADEWLGRFAAPVGGMYAATYIGGSANLSAVALHYGVTDEPALFAATNVADSVVGTLWIAALVILAACSARARSRPWRTPIRSRTRARSAWSVSACCWRSRLEAFGCRSDWRHGQRDRAPRSLPC